MDISNFLQVFYNEFICVFDTSMYSNHDTYSNLMYLVTVIYLQARF